MEYSEKEGIQAIIDLQKMAGITETEEQAKVGWRKMTARDKKSTERAHKLFCGKGGTNQ